MIKRVYKKPRIKFENFGMSVKIAACVTEVIMDNDNPVTATTWDEVLGWVFDVDVNNAKCKYDVKCYHTPTADAISGFEAMGGFSAS